MTYAVSAVSTSGTPLSGQVFGTQGVSKAPGTSFATYTGDYAGTITTTGASQTVSDTITGSVTIGANFDSNTFQGNINDRQSFQRDGTQRGVGSTVGFSGRISSDLSFQGTASGGGLNELQLTLDFAMKIEKAAGIPRGLLAFFNERRHLTILERRCHIHRGLGIILSLSRRTYKTT